MAPAIIGTLFNNERRQTPFLIELDGFVMQALLKLPRNKARLAGEKPFASSESSGHPVRPVPPGLHHFSCHSGWHMPMSGTRGSEIGFS
jgi:hypothetical protein